MDSESTWLFRCFILIISTILLGFKLFRSAIKTISLVKKVEKIDGPNIPWYYWLWYGNLYALNGRSDGELIINRVFSLLSGLTFLYPDKLARIWLGFRPVIVVHRADHAEAVLSSNVNINKALQYDMLKPWLNEGLLVSGGSKWHQRRKFLTPTFHFNILEEFVPVMNEQAILLGQIIREKIRSKPGQFLDVVPFVTNAALDIISETAMGVKINAQQNPRQDYVQGICRLSHIAFKRMLYPWLQDNFTYFNLIPEGREHRQDLNRLHRFTMDVIAKRKEEMIKQLSKPDEDAIQPVKRSGGKRRLAFMDLLIEQHLVNPNKFTELDIREEVDTFMFEGHDTTAMSMIWTLYLLGNHLDIQRRVQEEIDAIRNEEDEFNWNQSQLRQMKLLEACIKESLRLYPSVPFIARVAEQDVSVGNDQVIPEGVTIFLFLWIIQRDPKYFNKPNHFIPERFIEGSDHYQGRINPFAYVPFSAGPRNCIGQKFALQEEKIVLATLFSQFNVRSQLPVNEALSQPDLILRPKSVINLKFEPRNV